MAYRYKPEVLAELAGYGVFPRPHTRPELVIEDFKWFSNMKEDLIG